MKCILKLVIVVTAILSAFPLLSAQDADSAARGRTQEEMHIRYRVAKANIEKNYMGNAQVLERIVDWTEEVQKDTMLNILSVEFCGAVSPEGSVQFNHWLSVARLKALEKYVRKRVYIPEELVVRSDHYIAWDELKAMVSGSDLPNKDEVLAILNMENTSVGNELDSRIGALKAMDGGKTWRIIFNRYFADLRNAYMVIVAEKSEKFWAARRRGMIPSLAPLTDALTYEGGGLLQNESVLMPPPDRHYMYVKTNVAGLGLLMANLALEFDLGNYLSLNIPVYYSAVNYFVPTVKFRTLAAQPELRVWPLRNKDGVFFGVHAGFAYYNFAWGGKWRYQDHDGSSPTLGGGFTLGYRLPISKNKNWKLELGVGAGVYPVYYDMFYNVRSVQDGQLYDTRKRSYIGLDNVQISISYRIPMKKEKQ